MNLNKSRVMSLLTSILVIGSSVAGFGANVALASSSPITVTFESNDNSGYNFVDYDGNVSSTTSSAPAGAGFTSGVAMKMDNDGAPWSGTTFLTIDATSSLLSSANKTASLSIYAPDALDRCVDLKLEGTAVAEKTLHISGSGWQTLTFDYSDSFSATANYTKASLMPNIANVGCSDWGTWPKGLTTWYVDNISFPGAVKADVVVPRTTPSVLVNFESNDTSGYSLTGFGGVTPLIDTGAPAGGSVGSVNALNIKDNGDCWAGTTFLKRGVKESLLSASHKVVTANIYAPASGKVIKLKLENISNGNLFKEADVTSVQGWKTYSFDFTGFDESVDYNVASIFVNFTCGGGSKDGAGWGVDDVAFNGATAAGLAPIEPVAFNGNAVVRLAGLDATNSFNRQGDADFFVSQTWYRGGLRVLTKQVPVASTQHLTYVVSDAANGRPLANVTVSFIFGKDYSGSNAKVNVGSASSTGGQQIVTGVTGSDGTVSFDIVNTDVAADAADNPGTNLGADYTGKHLFTQVAAWINSQNQDSIDLVDLVYYKPADAPVVKTVVARMNGLDSASAYEGSCAVGNWCQYYAAGLRYFEKGLTVGSTTTFSYTVTDTDGAPYANKSVYLLLGKGWSGSTAKVTVNGVSTSGADCWCGNDQAKITLTTNAQGQVSFSLTSNDAAVDADPYQAGNLAHPNGGKHLFTQMTLIGEKGNADVLDIVDLNFYKDISSLPPTIYNARLADWNASNSFDGTHIWGDGGLGSWFDIYTGYFAHYVRAGTTFNLRYKVTLASNGANAPDGTPVTIHLGRGWSGSNAKFRVGDYTIDGTYPNGQSNDQKSISLTTVGGYATLSLTSLDDPADATMNPGNAKANPDPLSPLFMQAGLTVDGNSITHQDWVNIIVTQPQSAPSISSVSATSGKRGQAIDIVGTDLGDALGSTVTLFTPATAKTAAISTPVTILSVSADGTRLTVASPSIAQKGYFKVTNTGGTATASALFSSSTTATAKPAITLSSSIVKEVGSTFTLSGTNLASASTIAIGGVSAPFSILTANSVSVTVPAGVTSGSTISATNIGGTVTTSKFVFQAAVISSVTQSARVGDTVTVTGSNLKALSVVFAGNKSAKPVINTASQLTFVVPAGAQTGAIKITTGAGSVNTASFTVVPPAPTITSFTPTTGKKGVATVTVKGTNLLGATVTIGSTSVTLSSGATSTSFKFVIPSGAATGKITVTTAGGTVTSSASLTVTN